MIFFKKKTREQKVIESCGCVCYCPFCKDILNDQADVIDEDLVYYHCRTCGRDTIWTFDAPVPIFLRYGTKQETL